MPKLKTKSSAKKRFKLTATGKVKRKHAYTSHMMRHKSQKQKRQLRGMTTVAGVDVARILQWLPYAGKRKKATAAKKEA